MQARGLIMSERRVTGLSTAVIADLVAELGPIWQARRDAELLDRPRRRAVGAGAKYKLVFVDRLLATLVHLRHGVTHDVLACWFQVDRSTITVPSVRSGPSSPTADVASRVACDFARLPM
ncbi:helix-turn-helix domain-containing protein [Streptomyces albidoflavus]|uniref:helix-turn-helix domain-containing protein n=1 Tax=Streptomyces albidoflavus TaxID=1886 RepID=UPI0021B14AF7|nr:transposase family protein [Streptomyces albidoflavus]